MAAKTTFEAKCKILDDFRFQLAGDPRFQEFIRLNDIGFPAANFIVTGIFPATEEAMEHIDETFKDLLKTFGGKDRGFSNFDELYAEIK